MKAETMQTVRKFHRGNVGFIVTLGVIMGVTGLLMKFSGTTGNWTLIDMSLVRYIHNTLSLFFVASLAIMIVTGLTMFIVWRPKN